MHVSSVSAVSPVEDFERHFSCILSTHQTQTDSVACARFQVPDRYDFCLFSGVEGVCYLGIGWEGRQGPQYHHGILHGPLPHGSARHFADRATGCVLLHLCPSAYTPAANHDVDDDDGDGGDNDVGVFWR